MAHPLQAQEHSRHVFGNPGRDAGAAWDEAVRRGDFRAAWAVCDAVLAARDPATRDAAGVPYHERWVWDGTSPDGQAVLVRCYHGLGDTLQFSRYLPALRARAAHVRLEVQPELAGLLAGLADEVVPFDPAAPGPPRTCTLEIMELGHALHLAPPAPTLRVDAAPTDRVGLCWAAGGWDARRTLPARLLAPLLEVAPCISLQRGSAAAEGAALGLEDPLAGSMDMVATAGLVAGLAAVVTVDTMVAHLAAALGRPTLVLLPEPADWRWGVGACSPWYPEAQLFRQASPGEWGPAVAAIRRELARSKVHGNLSAVGT